MYHYQGEDGKRKFKLVSIFLLQGILSLIEESNKKTENCYYLFELSIDAACADMSSSGLSAGSIVCIVYVLIIIVSYFFL